MQWLEDADPCTIVKGIIHPFILEQVQGYGGLTQATHANHRDDNGLVVTSKQQLHQLVSPLLHGNELVLVKEDESRS